MKMRDRLGWQYSRYGIYLPCKWLVQVRSLVFLIPLRVIPELRAMSNPLSISRCGPLRPPPNPIPPKQKNRKKKMPDRRILPGYSGSPHWGVDGENQKLFIGTWLRSLHWLWSGNSPFNGVVGYPRSPTSLIQLVAQVTSISEVSVYKGSNLYISCKGSD